MNCDATQGNAIPVLCDAWSGRAVLFSVSFYRIGMGIGIGIFVLSVSCHIVSCSVVLYGIERSEILWCDVMRY